MKPLFNFQRDFLRSVVQGDFDESSRIRVYQRAYQARLADALARDFETIRQVLGADEFNELVREYIRQYPPRAFTLAELGRSFPLFLSKHDQKDLLPFLPDLAQLEWLLIEAFYSETARTDLSLEKVGSNSVLQFSPSLKLLFSVWPLEMLWRARKTPRERWDIPIVPKSQVYLIFRRGWSVLVQSVSQREGRALEEFQSGKTLLSFCESSNDLEPNELQNWLQNWVRQGWLIGAKIQ